MVKLDFRAKSGWFGPDIWLGPASRRRDHGPMAPDIWSRATRYPPQTRYLAQPTRYLPRQPPDICHYSHQISGWVHDPAGGILAPWDQISGLREQISGHGLPKPRILDRVHGQSRTQTSPPSPWGDAPVSGHGPQTRPTAAHAWFEIPTHKSTKNNQKQRILCQWVPLSARGFMVYCPKYNIPTTAATGAWKCAMVENKAGYHSVHTFSISASIWLYKKLVTFQTRVGQTTKHPTHCWTCKQTSCISSHTHPQPCA